MSTNSTKRRVKWLYYGRIAIACGLLLILLLKIAPLPLLFDTFAHIRLPLAALAFALSIASVAAKAQRWGIVLRSRGVEVRYQYLFTSYFVGLFFQQFFAIGIGRRCRACL